LLFQKFCIIQKGHFWNFINCPFSYIQKVWNGNLLHIKYLGFWHFLFYGIFFVLYLFYTCSIFVLFYVLLLIEFIIITFFAAYISCNLYISIFGIFFVVFGIFLLYLAFFCCIWRFLVVFYHFMFFGKKIFIIFT
jgi:hypothetical protein